MVSSLLRHRTSSLEGDSTLSKGLKIIRENLNGTGIISLTLLTVITILPCSLTLGRIRSLRLSILIDLLKDEAESLIILTPAE